MTVSRPTSTDQYTIRAIQECLEDEFRINHATAHNPDDLDVVRV
jgi:hypothetical protein